MSIGYEDLTISRAVDAGFIVTRAYDRWERPNDGLYRDPRPLFAGSIGDCLQFVARHFAQPQTETPQ